MAVLDALAQEFQQPLQQEPRQHTKSSRRRASKGFRDEVQKAHGNDEGPAKRQDESQVVDAPLAHQHKQPPSEERSRQKQRSGQKHAVRGWWVCVRESWFWASQVSTRIKCIIAPNVDTSSPAFDNADWNADLVKACTRSTWWQDSPFHVY